MIRLTQTDWRIFRRLQRKHKVSTEFLRYNLENIEKFIWFETWPRIVIRRYAVRKENRVFLTYYRLRRVLFDQSNRKMFKRMRQNIKQWSKRIVAWQKNHSGIKEYVEEVVYEGKSKAKRDVLSGHLETECANVEDVSKQLKEQLELLKNARRPQSLISNGNPKENNLCNDREACESHKEKQKSDSNNLDEVEKNQDQLNNHNVKDNTLPLDISSSPRSVVADKPFGDCATIDTRGDWQSNLESTPEKQITTQENIQPVKQLDTDEKTEKSHTESSSQQADKLKTGLNFLDMLICKVGGGSTTSTNCINNTSTYNAKPSTSKEMEGQQRVPMSGLFKENHQHYHEHSMDSTDEFLGFDDCERIPGMLMTPIVPHSTKNSKNSVFVSESLNEYMRLNDLETNYSIDDDKSVARGKIFARDMEGLMTPKTKPPQFDMPLVPENLLKFRTVAERKQYLQKFSKNYRLAIINNEASIYRELQRRMRTQKVKSASQIVAQSLNSAMSFTRNGWNAASFINTEFNKYYYQVLDVDHGTYKVRLRGARGNNEEFSKAPYVSRVIKPPHECFDYCADDKVWQYLKPIKTIAEKNKKLNRHSLPSVFKPCPLSHKTFQKPLDDDTAALLLAGGSMAVVRMPTVELEVFPEYGKPLHEIAKRYLQYILPHHDISREWAEFSVSTLQQPKTLKEAEQAAAKSFSNNRDFRKSYTFVIPYLNDRNHILVRRVVDRSEKLDESFEQSAEERELVPKTDFAFRQHLDLTDDVVETCADVVSDMINTVAISCSENSFIKIDPDGLNDGEASKLKVKESTKSQDISGCDRTVASPNTITAPGGVVKKHKKQNSLLLELKRLNATIIDAGVKLENDKKPCSKEYCQMGCICVSLEEIVPMREHCGKSKCMLECTCKSTSQSRIMRLETDGRSLTTEDAFLLRRKATARLARMEKEFTSTVVLTENETLLINETNNDKKRRCTKAPKRYEDFTDTEDEQRKNSPKKTALTTIDKEKHLAIEIKEMHDPVYVKDSILDQLKHCTVNLVPLPDMGNIAPWCMVHNLYKCFCKGRAVEGKPMIIEKEEVNSTTVEGEAEQKNGFDFNVSVKAKYTFDKIELRKNANNDKNNKDVASYNDKVSEEFNEEDQDTNELDDDNDGMKESKRKHIESKEVKSEKQKEQRKRNDDTEESIDDTFPNKPHDTEKPRSKRSLQDVRKHFYSPRPDSCRRHIATPRRMFLYCNRRRRLSILKYIKDNEDDKTRVLLNEHVMRSVYYHKIDIENHKKCNSSGSSKEKSNSVEKPNNSHVSKLKRTAESSPSPDVSKKKFLLVNEIVDLLDDEDDASISSVPNKTKDDSSQMSSSSTKSGSSFQKLLPDPESTDSTNHFQICTSGGVISVKKYPVEVQKNGQSQSPSPSSETITVTQKDRESIPEAGVDELKVPKISSCFSLNVKANIQKATAPAAATDEQSLDFTSATTVHSAAFLPNQNQQAKTAPNPLAAGTVAAKDTGSSVALDMDNENVKDVYNSVIKTMNTLVSKKMQDIDCALQRESHIIPTPNPDILCIMKWCNFLDAFCEGFAYVWQVKMKDITFFAITIQNIMPLIIGAMGIVNITALKAEKMPLMGRMLLQKFRNKETEKLAVVMQGKHSHWVVKGFLKLEPSTACNKPTPESHPSLTKKINVLCSLLVKQRQKENKKKEKLAMPWSAAQAKPTTQATQPVPQQKQAAASGAATATPATAPILQNRKTVAIQSQPTAESQSITQVQATPTPAPSVPQQNDTDEVEKCKQNDVDNGKVIAKINSRKRKADNAQSNSLFKMDIYNKMSSNIEFRSVTQSDIDEIFLPELHKLDHKWLVLDLHNDFSHIFVPDFRDLVSLDRIQKVINFARQKSKIVKLQFFQNAPFDAFVTPKSIRKIYFGPLTTNMKSPTLILLQSVDGQMMLRELYQLQHNIVKKPEERTKAFWLVHIKGQTHFEMDRAIANEKSAAENVAPSSCPDISLATTNSHSSTILSESATKTAAEEADKNVDKDDDDDDDKDNEDEDEDDDDDEDCMIIDDTTENYQSNSLNNAKLGQQTLATPKANHIDTPVPVMQAQSLLKVPNTNTIIKPLSSTNISGPVVINVPSMPAIKNPLPILTLPPNTIITGINPSKQLTNVTGAGTGTGTATAAAAGTGTQIVNMPKKGIITGIESAPPEAPYSSTIFITTSSASSNTSLVPSSASTATIGSTSTSTTLTSISSSEQRTKKKETKSTGSIKSANIIRQALEAGAIKRRRISLFCSNKYDKISENIAVDAVIRKILPESAQDIQINPLDEESKTSLTAADVVATVGSTQISKIATPSEPSPFRPTATIMALPAINTTETGKAKAPIVFDVNFMDDGDEPTASIVIKPTSSSEDGPAKTSNASKTQAKTVVSKTMASTAAAAATTTTTAPVPAKSTTVPPNTNSMTLPSKLATILASAPAITSSTNTTFTEPPQKKAQWPSTISNNIIAPTTATKTSFSGKGKLINSLLCSKQTNIVPHVSAANPAATKSANASCSSQPSSVRDNPVTSTQSPFVKSSISIKMQKGVSASVAAVLPSMKPITTTTTTNQVSSTSTLTVQQVQDMLKKPKVNTAALNASKASGVASPSPALPIHLLPTIKATITPAKVTAISSSSAVITPASKTTTSTGCVVSKSLSTPAVETTSLSPTLTISKVQSFGSSQKLHNSDKNLPTFLTPQTQIVINDVNDTVNVPSPPAHIQYGYIVSPTHANQKFVAKRVAEEFYVKVPSVGILKLQGLASVNNYLNKYVSRILKETPATSAVWQFLAASKAVQMQNHQKSLLVRKTKNTSGSAGIAKIIANHLSNSLEEPILIDD